MLEHDLVDKIKELEQTIKTQASLIKELKDACGNRIEQRGKTLINRVKCPECGGIITSKHTHDFVTCKCGKTSVDGGQSYMKRCFDPKIGFIEMSEYLTGVYE